MKIIATMFFLFQTEWGWENTENMVGAALENNSHWVLLVIQPVHQRILYYNSLGANPRMVEEYLHKIRYFFLSHVVLNIIQNTVGIIQPVINRICY